MLTSAVPWNTEETRRRLKQAATEEFAAHGLHGTTVDAIAKRARINKERLYNYFGSKEQLFATVLADELAQIAAAVPLDSLREEDIGEWAGRAYEYHANHPQLIRLLHWEALAYGDRSIVDEKQRTSYYRQKTRRRPMVSTTAVRDGCGATVRNPNPAVSSGRPAVERPANRQNRPCLQEVRQMLWIELIWRAAYLPGCRRPTAVRRRKEGSHGRCSQASRRGDPRGQDRAG